MANTRFPLILNGIKFQVNPQNLSIEKPLVYQELATQSGIQYQIWYDRPEVLTIQGISAGETAFRELLFLKENFETTSLSRISELFYKTQVYKGFITNLVVGHSLNEHLRFPYQLNFQLFHGERFNIQDLSLEAPQGIIGQVSGVLEETVNAPIARSSNALGKLFGKVI